MPIQTSFISLALTTSDDPQPITTDPAIVLSDMNVHVYTAAVAYGNGSIMSASISANAVVSFQGKIRLMDLQFKSYTPGVPGLVVVVGPLVS